jgi:HD-GYP domain-containing protein (c-di-GMP phosphodiesterase class II)
MTEPRAPWTPSDLERLIVRIAAAVNTRSLYAAEHPRSRQAVAAVLDAVAAACAERRRDEVTFLVVGEDLVVDQRPLPASLHHRAFVRTLTRRGVERLTLSRGLPADECLAFVEAMASGRAPASTPHLVVGRVELAVSEGEKDQGAALRPEQVSEVREAWGRFRKDPREGLGRMEDLVWAMMESLERATREALALAPLKEHDEYTFVHSVNVSFLTLAQARSFGFRGEMLHALGLAALTHDVGKLTVPLSVLNKPGKLEGEDWIAMMSHAEAGAWTLCGLEGSHPLATVVAYEHHLRYDGGPAYPALRKPRRPSLASQLTAISDVFDALCTLRPYSRPRSRREAFEVLAARAGTFHDPLLVGGFRRIVEADAAAA